MNLGDLISHVGNLLDYDPSNDQYRAQLASILNDTQARILTDRPWDFAQRDQKLSVWTDEVYSVGLVSGSSAVSGGPFPVSASAVRPGSPLDRAVMVVTDPSGKTGEYTIAWVKASNQLFLDRDFTGVSGAYDVKVKRREIFLSSDAVQVQNISDPIVGTPAQTDFLSKFERDSANLDRELLGTIESYIPSSGRSVPSPQFPRGVAKVAAVGQGARTIHVWMVNVQGPLATNVPVYPVDASDGFEGAFSKVETFELSDTETLTFTPETLPSKTGLYRRYYFTCPEAGILAPLRVRNATTGQGFPVLNVDTVNPDGGVTLRPDLSLGTLQSQAFLSVALRWQSYNAGRYQSFLLYPHPSADQALDVRVVVAPPRMYEDSDPCFIPDPFAELIALGALEDVALKTGNAPLSQVYARKKQVMYQAFEQAYLKVVPRRIVKGDPLYTNRYGRNPYGPLRLIP